MRGGAGVFGSSAVVGLRQGGRGSVGLDDLSTGSRRVVPEGVAFVLGDAGDKDLVRGLIARHAIDSVIHFAGSILVEQSVSEPLRYRSEEHTSELQSLMRISYAVFCLKKKKKTIYVIIINFTHINTTYTQVE